MDTKLNFPIDDTWIGDNRPYLIAGPCSAETETQVLKTAEGLFRTKKINAFRAGIWKPRTRPGDFEGIGSKGLIWLAKVKAEFGFLVATEVANEKHVKDALDSGIDILWIGARTTTNPFAVQEIANSLKGKDVIVMIKNPMNPDLELWLGAIERISSAGIKKLVAVHRGFSTYEHNHYRNSPKWQIALDLRRRYPDLSLICDPSHMAGQVKYLAEISQKAMDLNYAGLMIESHIDPCTALSDKNQQLTPKQYENLISGLVLRASESNNQQFVNRLADLRSQIDAYDERLLEILSQRMKLVEQIGQYKKENGIVVYQDRRWREIMKRVIVEGTHLGLSEHFIEKIFRALHEESINHQIRIMND